MTTSHPWLSPNPATVAKIAARCATTLLRDLAQVPAHRLGARASAWPPLLRVLPVLLKTDSKRVLDAVCRVDALHALQDLAAGNIGRLRFEGAAVEGERLERALLTLWLGLAGHPGLSKPLVLPGPFHATVIDPHSPRLLAFGNVRALAATDKGLIVLGQSGQVPIQKCVVAALPAVGRTVIVDAQRTAADAAVVQSAQEALARVGEVLPFALERIRIASEQAGWGEACVSFDVTAADLVASAQAAFLRAALAVEPLLQPLGALVQQHRRVTVEETLARLCGEVVALPWRVDRPAVVASIQRDLADLQVLVEPTLAAEPLLAALRDAVASGASAPSRRALLVNVDADDFVYSFQFGQSVERRCHERRLQVDRILIDNQTNRDLAGEMGDRDLAPAADGTEVVVASEQDPLLSKVLPLLAKRQYEAVVINARPRLFYDLLDAGLLTAPTRVWDRHLHDGLREVYQHRGSITGRVPDLRVWSLQGGSGDELVRGNQTLFDAGFEHIKVRPWPLDLEYFRTAVARQPNLLFAGGDSGRDWPLLVEAMRDLPYDIHLVTRQPPPGLPPQARVDARLPLWRFRDAMAAASVIAIPVRAGFGASGVTVLPMAMALGVAAVVTRTSWVEQYVSHGEEALLVPAGDAAAFRAALLRLHQEPHLREQIVANARRRVEALCDLDAFTREIFATLN